MDILWEPEPGNCSECGRPDVVRDFTSRGRIRTFCFPCWDASQLPRTMSSRDWEDDERVVFELPDRDRPSRAA